MLIGNGSNARKLFIIDYGHSITYGTNENLAQMYNEDKQEEATSIFASVNAQLGNELKIKDDLESIGYLLLYFLEGSLPWQSLDAKTNKEKITLMKKSIVTELKDKDICSTLTNHL